MCFTNTFEKYAVAFTELKKQISHNQLECNKFIKLNSLPGNFLTACEKIGFIKRIAKGTYVIKYEGPVNRTVGRLIDENILNIEKIRKQHFNTINK